MSRIEMKVLTGLTLAALAVSGAYAQDKKKGSNVDAAKAGATSAEVQAVQARRTADALARYGDAKKDALALIVAAKIKKEAGGQELKADKTSKGGQGEAKGSPDKMTPEAMLERARALASGRSDLLALADDVAKAGGRGATGGPKCGTTVVRNGATDQFRVGFRGGEPAMVAISGDGDSRLDLFVFDENANRVCSQVGPGDDAACRWTPRWTGDFLIRVANYGVANQYRICTN